MSSNKIAIEPKSFSEYEAAVVAAGGDLVEMSSEVSALIWTDYARPHALAELLKNNPQIKWVQLPFAGVDAFKQILKTPGVRFTSAKGSYREPVAEHALALILALARKLPERVMAKSWGKKFAFSLYDSNILIVGGGGITEEFLKYLPAFNADVTVVRKRPIALKGATRTVGFADLDKYLVDADVVLLAAALTDETTGLFDRARFALMKPTAYLVNVARGPMIVTEDLIAALEDEVIAAAATDVTDPEPLPDGHALWTTKNMLITPHTADTNAQVIRLFSIRIDENVKAYLGRGDWVGEVDPELGY